MDCRPSVHVAAIDFRYSDPERGFDRSRVKGVVAKLTRVADPSTATALEVAAGGKLYQVCACSKGSCWAVGLVKAGGSSGGCCESIAKVALPTFPLCRQPAQVVVDSEQTAKALLANGQLRQRVTIIPLNKCEKGWGVERRAPERGVGMPCSSDTKFPLQFTHVPSCSASTSAGCRRGTSSRSGWPLPAGWQATRRSQRCSW